MSEIKEAFLIGIYFVKRWFLGIVSALPLLVIMILLWIMSKALDHK